MVSCPYWRREAPEGCSSAPSLPVPLPKKAQPLRTRVPYRRPLGAAPLLAAAGKEPTDVEPRDGAGWAARDSRRERFVASERLLAHLECDEPEATGNITAAAERLEIHRNALYRPDGSPRDREGRYRRVSNLRATSSTRSRATFASFTGCS